MLIASMKNKTTRKNKFKRKRPAQKGWLRRHAGQVLAIIAGTLVMVVTSCAFIFVYDCFTQARHFEARRIIVSGNHRLDRQTILTASGIQKGTNILAVNLAKARGRLLAHPWIADATVSRKIPSTLAITVVEEKPLAVLDLEGDQDFVINVNGEVFKRVDGSDNTALVRVQGLTACDLPVPGMPATRIFQSVMALLHMAGKEEIALPLADVRRIHLDREIGVTVYMGEKDRAVKLGFGQYEKKIAALGQLMEHYDGDNRLTCFRVIDLFDINRIVVTPALAEHFEDDHEEV